MDLDGAAVPRSPPATGSISSTKGSSGAVNRAGEAVGNLLDGAGPTSTTSPAANSQRARVRALFMGPIRDSLSVAGRIGHRVRNLVVV